MSESEQSSKKKLNDLRVVDLRNELEKRSLDKAGVKPALIERLTKALKDNGEDPDTYLFEIAIEKPVVMKSPRISRKGGLEKTNEEGEEEESEEPMDTDDSKKDVSKDDESVQEEGDHMSGMEEEEENSFLSSMTKNIKDSAAKGRLSPSVVLTDIAVANPELLQNLHSSYKPTLVSGSGNVQNEPVLSKKTDTKAEESVDVDAGGDKAEKSPVKEKTDEKLDDKDSSETTVPKKDDAVEEKQDKKDATATNDSSEPSEVKAEATGAAGDQSSKQEEKTEDKSGKGDDKKSPNKSVKKDEKKPEPKKKARSMSAYFTSALRSKDNKDSDKSKKVEKADKHVDDKAKDKKDEKHKESDKTDKRHSGSRTDSKRRTSEKSDRRRDSVKSDKHKENEKPKTEKAKDDKSEKTKDDKAEKAKGDKAEKAKESKTDKAKDGESEKEKAEGETAEQKDETEKGEEFKTVSEKDDKKKEKTPDKKKRSERSKDRKSPRRRLNRLRDRRGRSPIFRAGIRRIRPFRRDNFAGRNFARNRMSPLRERIRRGVEGRRDSLEDSRALEIARRNREEAFQLEREKDRLRIEKEKLERLRAEVIRKEREQQREEREKIERERDELRRRSQMPPEMDFHHGMKRSFDEIDDRDFEWERRKRLAQRDAMPESLGRYEDMSRARSGNIPDRRADRFEGRSERFENRSERFDNRSERFEGRSKAEVVREAPARRENRNDRSFARSGGRNRDSSDRKVREKVFDRNSNRDNFANDSRSYDTPHPWENANNDRQINKFGPPAAVAGGGGSQWISVRKAENWMPQMNVPPTHAPQEHWGDMDNPRGPPPLNMNRQPNMGQPSQSHPMFGGPPGNGIMGGVMPGSFAGNRFNSVRHF